MQLILIRHGESQANTGASRHHDSALTERGHAQMEATARFLADRIGDASTWRGIASPYLRTLESAAAVSRALGLAFTTDWRVREYCGPDGPADDGKPIPWARPEAPHLDAFLAPPRSAREPWFERPETRSDLEVRLRDVLADAARDGTDLIIVTHGSPVLMLHALMRSPIPDYPGWSDQIPNASVTWFRDGAELHFAAAAR